MDSLEQRVDRLEKSVRRWRAGACVCGVVLAAAVLVGAQRQNDDRVATLLKTRGINVVDDRGNVVFSVTANKKDGRESGAILSVNLGEPGAGELVIGEGKEGPTISLAGPRNHLAARITAPAGGRLTLYDADGNEAQVLQPR